MIDPWDMESPEDFLYYCSPECDIKCQGQNDFKNHALGHHQRAQSLFFEDKDLARTAADKLIAIQQKSSSPSVGHSALLEALSSAEASQENSKETPSVKDTNNTSEDEEEMDLDNSKPKCSNCGILCHITHTTPDGIFCGDCRQVSEYLL